MTAMTAMTAMITVEPDRAGRGLARRSASIRGVGESGIRVAPVPRSEPPTDDELGVAGLYAPPMTAMLLPLDLATGAQVRRNRRPFGRGRRAPGTTEGGAGDRPDSGPAASGHPGQGAGDDDVVWAERGGLPREE